MIPLPHPYRMGDSACGRGKIGMSPPLCHCEERSDVAISCMAERCSKKLINIVNLGYSMLIGTHICASSVLEIPTSALWASSE